MSEARPIYARCPCCGQEMPDRPRLDEVAVALALSGNKRRLFWVLAAARGRYLSKKDLETILWGDRADGGPEAAAQVISRLILELRRDLARYKLRLQGVSSKEARIVATWAIVSKGHAGHQLVLQEAA